MGVTASEAAYISLLMRYGVENDSGRLDEGIRTCFKACAQTLEHDIKNVLIPQRNARLFFYENISAFGSASMGVNQYLCRITEITE